MKEKILKFCKAQPVLLAALAAALITVPVIPPDAGYLDYCNTAVLIELFSLMAVIAGLRSIGIFGNMTDFLLSRAGTVRRLGVMLILISFFSAMLVTNDVALLTFVPLTVLTFRNIPGEKHKILTVVLENAAANLGSMLTPVGNPQNLYLYDTYHLTTAVFFRTMIPTGIAGLCCILLLTFLLPAEPCRPEASGQSEIPKPKLAVYSVLFVFCLLTVFRIVPDWVCLIVTVLVILLTDRKLLLKVDYALLATFVCFFVFVGNIARIDAVSEFFSKILTGRELLISVLLSQVISNVPAAVMLSGFTDNGTALLLGVNLGGLGTLIASLASLISYQCYQKSEHPQSGKYLLIFSAVNFGTMAVLLLLQIFVFS